VKRGRLDQIKDAIDRLNEIRSAKRRVEAARELIDYIELHHLSSWDLSLARHGGKS